MMGSLTKPHDMTIKKHVSRFKTMNGYISLLPTLRDSSLVVASTKKENVPFNNATLASIVLATCHINWRNLYELNHKTVPESTRSMLHDLETIEKVFVEKNNKKAKAMKAKAGTAPQYTPQEREWRRFGRTSPQEGTHRQVLQVVPDDGWALQDP
jgi:hypothetical protein